MAVTPAIAQSTSPTPTGTSLQNAIKNKVQEEIDAIKKSVSKRSYVGEITKISDLDFTLNSLTDEARSITITTDTTIKLLSGKDGVIKDIKEKDFLIAMGDADGAGILTAKRVVVIAKPTTDTRQAVSGTITKVSLPQITLETPSATLVLRTSSDTKFSSSSKTTALKDLKVGQTLVAIVKPTTTKDTFTATRLLALAQSATFIPLKHRCCFNFL
jgi:uncharacterized protein YlzI (FlbEa/FlbD family)